MSGSAEYAPYWHAILREKSGSLVGLWEGVLSLSLRIEAVIGRIKCRG